jgi:hypothetical protein
MTTNSSLLAQSNNNLTTLPNDNYQSGVAGASGIHLDGATKPSSSKIANQVIPYSLQTAEAANSTTPTIDLRLPPLNVEQLQREDQAKSLESSTLRIGIVRELPQAVMAAGKSNMSGHWHTTADGGNYWTLIIESPQAKAIRIHLENLTIPPGGHVMVYNTYQPSEIYGPYRQSDLYGYNDLWTASVFGSVVTVEYYVPPHIPVDQFATFQVTAITHQYADMARPQAPQLLTCHNDVACYEQWITDANAVAGIGVIDRTGVLSCSGALLNDFDDATWEGYFLTANHCLSGSTADLGTQEQANTIEFYWFYQNSSCDGIPPDLAKVPRTTAGADLLSRQTGITGNDHALLRIRHLVPDGVFFLGWDTSPFGVGEDNIGIHHPEGSFKRISFGSIIRSDENFWTTKWSSGTLEPRSSGSPIFDSSHRVRGQAFASDLQCEGYSQYGRFNMTYPYIQRWLEIGGTINVDRNFGGNELGTPNEPFRSLNAANNFAWDDVRIKIKANNYPEAITFSRPMMIIADSGTVTIGQ